MYRLKRFFSVCYAKMYYFGGNKVDANTGLLRNPGLNKETANFTKHRDLIVKLMSTKLAQNTSLRSEVPAWYVVLSALTAVGAHKWPHLSSTVFPYKIDIGMLCRKEFKSQMVESLTCPCALPSNGHIGKTKCYQYSEPACKLCWVKSSGSAEVANSFEQTVLPRRLYLKPSAYDTALAKRLFVDTVEKQEDHTNFVLKDENWEESDTVTFQAWQDLNGKNHNDLHQHANVSSAKLCLFSLVILQIHMCNTQPSKLDSFTPHAAGYSLYSHVKCITSIDGWVRHSSKIFFRICS